MIRTPELLQEVTEVDFQQWKHHPMSQMFFGFLADNAQNYRDHALSSWEAGTIKLSDEVEIRARITICGEMIGLSLQDIQAFYEKAKQE